MVPEAEPEKKKLGEKHVFFLTVPLLQLIKFFFYFAKS